MPTNIYSTINGRGTKTTDKCKFLPNLRYFSYVAWLWDNFMPKMENLWTVYRY